MSNLNITRSTLEQSIVVKGIVEDLPGGYTPVKGDQFIISNASGSGSFANVPDNSIAQYDGTKWIISAPSIGEIAFNLDDNSLIFFTPFDSFTIWEKAETFYRFDIHNQLTNNIVKGFITFKNQSESAVINDMITYSKDSNAFHRYVNGVWSSVTFETNDTFISIDDGCLYELSSGSSLVLKNIATPTKIFRSETQGFLGAYDDISRRFHIIASDASLLAYTGITTNTLDSEPANASRGGKVNIDTTNGTSLMVSPTIRGALYNKFAVYHAYHKLTIEEANAKSFNLDVPIAVGKSGISSMRLAVNGVQQIITDDYIIDSNKTTISWSGLGMDNLSLPDMVGSGSGVGITMTYMIERANPK